VPDEIADRKRGWRLPLFASLQGYQRSWLSADLVAAATLLAIAIPEQLATARLAGMPPITGYYAFVAGTVLFALLGTHPQLSVGADSTIAPLFAVVVVGLAPVGGAHYAAQVGILAVMTGVLVFLVGLLRFGWIAQLLSAPIIAGFLAGVAVIIVIHQLPDLLGLPAVSGSPVHRVVTAARHLADGNVWSICVAVAVLVVIVIGGRVDRKLPAALLGLLAATVAVGGLDLRGHGVAVLGAVAHEAPHVGLTGLSWHVLRILAPGSAVIALVIVSQTAATTRAFADPSDHPINVSRDFAGVGAGSIAAGLVGAFAVNASPPRTQAAISAGGRSQLAGLVAAAIVVALVPAAGLLRDVPLAALAAVLLYIAGRIFRLRELVAIARFDGFEFGLAVVALLTVVFVGVEQGIAVSVGLAILDRTRLSARPQAHVLGRIPGTTSWVPKLGPQTTVEVPGVRAVLFATPLWYANADRFSSELDAVLDQIGDGPTLLVLDVVGMTDIDFTGTRAVAALLDRIEHTQVSIAMARAGAHLRNNLTRAGLLDRIGADNFHDSVDAAVTTVTGSASSGPP
jgi:SulP family sulfate permease